MELCRRLRRTVITSGKVWFLVAVSASAFASVACGGAEQAREWSAAEPEVEREAGVRGGARAAEATAEDHGNTTGAMARAGHAQARAGGGAMAQAGEVQVRPGNTVIVGNSGEDAEGSIVGVKANPREVRLQITGDPGTRFSGACSVGGEERALDGRVPERYAIEQGGKKLECEIHKVGGGALEIVFAAGEAVRSVHRVDGQESTVRFALSNGSVSSSSTSSVSVDQSVTSSKRTYSNDSP